MRSSRPIVLLAGLLAGVAACSAPGRAPAPGGFPAFPSSPTPPPAPEVAAMLAGGLPAADRAAATRLLLDDILPWDLRDLPSDPRANPGPRAIARAAYGTLARQLGEAPADQRLARLATIACHRRGVRVTGRATALAVARYVRERGRPRTNLVVGYLAEAQPYLAMSPEAQLAEADRLERDLAAFERAAAADRACAARQGIAVVHARHALALARTGRFDAAIGPVYVFLRNAGETPQRIAPP